MQFNDCHIGPGARHECGSRIAGDQLIRSVDENRANADEPGKDGLRDPYAAGIGPLQIVDDEAGAAPPRACGAPPPAAASGGSPGPARPSCGPAVARIADLPLARWPNVACPRTNRTRGVTGRETAVPVQGQTTDELQQPILGDDLLVHRDRVSKQPEPIVMTSRSPVFRRYRP